MDAKETITLIENIKSNDQPLFFMLGPCAIENEYHSLKIAEALKKLSEKLKFPLIFKSSFDKANRCSIHSYRSVGLKNGLEILNKVKQEFELPIVTDIHETSQVDEVAAVADIVQIPAFLCRQTDLLTAAGKSGKIVNIKKGQFASPNVLNMAAEKVTSTGNDKVWLCERGYTFGYGDLIVDFRSFPQLKSFGHPVVYDATHAVQRPSALGTSSGGDRSFVADLAIAAVSTGIAGLFMELHEEPEKALCDGPNSIRLSQLEDLLRYLIDLDSWIKTTKRPIVY